VKGLDLLQRMMEPFFFLLASETVGGKYAVRLVCSGLIDNGSGILL
jgi:hypothetical protein